ncbi:MAG: HupE/UreJ family protein [Chromatiaceae bacterium]|nr:HupE/UreJ family protein [Gammaproteobacteria bacterium]MCP5303826.1 HupE/UreJ family protein [Chromatiaceae bacterium]MCP5313553.1 HupE/UreJ family protein [Chromatiaceae bacterium]
MNLGKYLPKDHVRGTLAVSTGLLLTASFPAFAHHAMGGMTPQTFDQGLLSGLAHPVIGLDHFAFLVVAMLLTAAMKGSARYIVPLAFVGATIGGTALHLGAADIPMSETLVALSVVIGGVLVLTRHYPGAFALGALFAVAGILHGYAYGESIVGAEATPLLAYLIGFAAIQYALIIGGVLGLQKLAERSETARSMAAHIGSTAALLTGGLFLALSFA